MIRSIELEKLTLPESERHDEKSSDDDDQPREGFSHRFRPVLLLVLGGILLVGFIYFIIMSRATPVHGGVVGLLAGTRGPTSTSNVAMTTTLPSPQLQFNSTLRFVLFVGLEGTGHHFLITMLEGAPALKQLTQWGIIPDEVSTVQRLLFKYDGKEKTGLWNAHCESTKIAQHLDLLHLQDDIANELQRMNSMATNSTTTTHVPLNPIHYTDWYGMMSYPNFLGDCRRLNIPYLDLLYRACTKAKVDCGHVYMYRDAHALIKSNSINRDFNSDQSLLATLHMYKTHLNVIASEIHAFPQHTWGCYNLLGGENSTDNWHDAARQMWWGSTNNNEFDQHIAKIFHQPGNGQNNESSKKTLDIPKQWEPYWKTFEDANERTMRICQKALAGRLEAA